MAGVRSRLREIRLMRGLTQQALAQMAGLTRQTIGSVEAGDSGPSIEVGLRLAKVLGVPLGDLFSLDPDFGPDAELLPPGLTTRVLAAIVGDREVLRPAARLGAYRWPGAAADGLAERDAKGQVSFRRFGAPRSDTLFFTGCDPALGLLEGHLQQQGMRAFWFTAGSGAALDDLAQGRTHFAAVHWTQDDEAPPAPPGVARIVLSSWQMGFVLRQGAGRPDLATPGLRVVNREPGAGARRLLDTMLARAGVEPGQIAGYDRLLAGHWEVADAVAQGAADLGVASGAAASAFSLAFVPLSFERSELWWRQGSVPADVVQRLGDTLASAFFRRDLSTFGPFDTSGTGTVPETDQRGKG